MFICDDWQMHVYARETRAHIVSFPPARAPPANIARLGFCLSITDDFKALPDAERVDGGAPAARAISHGAVSGTPAYAGVIARSIAMVPAEHREEDIMYGFSA